MKYNKLVRDRIPEIIAKSGKLAVTHCATPEEYRKKLLEKLGEEVKEVQADPSQEELADLLEVIYALRDDLGFKQDELESIRLKKAEERGSFAKKIILEEATSSAKYE